MYTLARHGRACALLLITSAPVMAGPEQADAAAPPTQYRSAFGDYTPFRQTELAPWRAVNDTARQLGGHMGHLPQAPGTPSPPQPHVHGHGHGGTP